MSSSRLRQATHLILDYDGTLTVKDTMALLGKLPESPTTTWEEIADAYIQDCATFKKQPYPWNKYDRQEYSNWLASRRWLEERSATRVQDAAFFRGVTHQHVNATVAESWENGSLELRNGWEKLMELFLPDYDVTNGASSPSRVSILSVNWSETAIRRAIWQAATTLHHPEKDKLCHLINDMLIHANEIEGLGSPLGSSGRVCRGPDLDIRTSRDKLRHLPPSQGARGSDAPYLVYVGDSSTDFDSLCAADLGIWICPVSESEYAQAFADVFKPLDFIPPPLTSFQHAGGKDALFYWAPNLQTVYDALTIEITE
ncbi:uncharacterized protein RCC_04338 [Ramularia collo-cygni]|uniref:Haloacid dehalogenase-like hydrolase n=1 Tax=Ramularia collo-cygni TaxID=112498 RepID=A0A2D3VD71_9PEZI|nr:uncharacterized protein RCC_04338 [Ramularia collo-cygni]CZT18493.1 uncharacterized protein RCC_04338 [Ramularia collo-cygni]